MPGKTLWTLKAAYSMLMKPTSTDLLTDIKIWQLAVVPEQKIALYIAGSYDLADPVITGVCGCK